MQNVEQILAMPKLETFTASGKAPDVIHADRMAWNALETVLGVDPVAAWKLAAMQHNFDPETQGVNWQAEFARKPDEQ